MAVAMPAMAWLCGPPWSPGNTAMLILVSTSTPLLFFRKKMIPALGPLRVLCTVLVTMSQYSKGEGTTPAATSPATWAMSDISQLPFLSAIVLNLL